MPFQVSALRHVCLLAPDLDAAKDFYGNALGLAQADPQRPHVFQVASDFEIHLCSEPSPLENVSDPTGWPFSFSSLPVVQDSQARHINHFALLIDDLAAVRDQLLDHGLTIFQMDEDGNRRDVSDKADSLNFGIGSLFTYDPAGNLIELGTAGTSLSP